MALSKQNMRAACPKVKLEFKIFQALYVFYVLYSIFHFRMKVDRVMLIKATGDPLSQALIGRDAQAVGVKCRLLTEDCGPGVKCRLSVKCRLQTESKMQARGKMQN